MKILVAVLTAGFLAQQPVRRAFQVTYDKHPPIALNTALQLEGASTEPAFRELLTIGVDNHMPIGIVLGAEPSLCYVPLEDSPGKITVAELIATINAKVPGYRAELQDGVLDIAPVDLPSEVARLLDMRLAEFHSGDDLHTLMGSTLWTFIRAAIAPDEGTAGGGQSSTMVEKVPGMSVTDQTVRSILNSIVDKGSGGAWILHTSKVTDLDSTRQRPYEIYGYVGEEQHVKSELKCSD